MTEIITDDILDSFENLASYDIKTFLSKYLDFIDTHYANIINLYSGTSNVVPADSFASLNWLIDEQKKIIDSTIQNNESLSNYEYWALLEYIEDIGHTLETADNSSKWLRSAISKNGYKQQVILEHVMSQGQDLSKVERSVLKSNNSRDSWVETALENDLKEEGYNLEGGYLIKVIYKNSESVFLEGIIDNIDSPEKTYGLDIDKRIAFENDDVVVLTYEDTLVQCANILGGLKKEDDPAYPDRGVNAKGIVGSNVAAISYPTIFRELAENFATDDSFKSISITDISRSGDAVYLDYKIETKAGDLFDRKVQL